MKNALFLAVLACACGTARAADEIQPDPQAIESLLPTEVREPLIVEAPAVPPLEPVEDPDRADPYVGHLAGYLLEDIIEHWTPAPKQVPTASLPAVAWDMSRAVVHEPEDPGHCATVKGTDGRKRCLWGVPGWNSDHGKAVLLAAVGYWEGARYAKNVDDLSCNDAAWRADPANSALIHLTGNCDGGRAHSIFQIWPRTGSASVSPINESCSKDAVSVRYTAARCALQILRMSMMHTGDLTGYTGETATRADTGDDDHRALVVGMGGASEGSWGGREKAMLRMEFARKALKKHPFTP